MKTINCLIAIMVVLCSITLDAQEYLSRTLSDTLDPMEKDVLSIKNSNEEIMVFEKVQSRLGLDLYRNRSKSDGCKGVAWIENGDQLSGIVQDERGKYVRLQGTPQKPVYTPLVIERSFHCGHEPTAEQVSYIQRNAYPSAESTKEIETQPEEGVDFALGMAVFVPEYLVLEGDTLVFDELRTEILKRYEMVRLIYREQVGVQLSIDTVVPVPREYVSDSREFLTRDNYLRDHPWDAYPLKHFVLADLLRTAFLGQSSLHACEGASWSLFSDDPFFDAIVWAHELGHSFGAIHTNSCLWPGGAIDSCWQDALECFLGVHNRDQRATIMSGCNLHQMEFLPWAVEIMRGYLRWQYCYDFEDNATTHGGRLKFRLNEFDRPPSKSVRVEVRHFDHNFIRKDTDVPTQPFRLSNDESGHVVGDGLLTYAGNVAVRDYLFYPSLNNFFTTLILPSFPDDLQFDIIPTVDQFDIVLETEDDAIPTPKPIVRLSNTRDLTWLNPTQEELRYTSNNVTRGKNALSITAPNYCFDSLPEYVFPEDSTSIRIKARRCPGMNQLTAVVVDQYFTPMPDIPVQIEGPVTQMGYTNELGVMFFYNIPSGEYHIRVLDTTKIYGVTYGTPFYDEETIILGDERDPRYRLWRVRDIVAPPGRPYAFQPSLGKECELEEDILFRWSTTSTRVNHIFQIARDSLFLDIVHQNSDLGNKIWEHYIPSDSGTYYWRVKAINEERVESEWSDVMSFVVSPNTTTSAEHEHELHHLQFYPNPTRDYVSYDGSAPGLGRMQEIAVYNLLGQQVYRSELNSAEPSRIDLSSLSEGAYLVRILTEDGSGFGSVVIKK